ncbi:hypothetical protein GBA52_008877 [Prunus armeniaca]|nr:hypothetical protein GBA52_008877 [Prunus armeniaca]
MELAVVFMMRRRPVVKKNKAKPEEVEVQLSQYRHDGLPEDKRFNGKKALAEASVIVREHTSLTNMFMCLWFNEVVRFTSRDQLSFPYVLWRLKVLKNINTFPDLHGLECLSCALWVLRVALEANMKDKKHLNKLKELTIESLLEYKISRSLQVLSFYKMEEWQSSYTDADVEITVTKDAHPSSVS